MLLTDQEAEAREEERRWARELAEKFGTPGATLGKFAVPSAAKPAAGKSLLGTFCAEVLLRRVSCAEEFRHRDRPAFWLYMVGYGFLLLPAAFIFTKLGAPAPEAMLVMLGFSAWGCFRAWHRASPICPNCRQNIRICSAAFCHLCGQPLIHRRCEGCGLDNNWPGFTRSYTKAWSFRWIAYCPGCGVQLDSKVSRWRAGSRD